MSATCLILFNIRKQILAKENLILEMSDNISPAMLELRWKGLLQLEREEEAERFDEGLRKHFLLEFNVDDN